MFSGIPLPKVVADTVPGGNILAGMQAANAFNHGQLQNQYYGPNIQSEINQRNALTAIDQWKLKNPYSMLPDTIGLLNYLGVGGPKNSSTNETSNNNQVDNSSGMPDNSGNTNALNPSGNSDTTNPSSPPPTNPSPPSSPPVQNPYGNGLGANLLWQKLDPVGFAAAHEAAVAGTAADVHIGNALLENAGAAGNAQTYIKNALNQMDTVRPKLNWWEKGIGFGDIHHLTSNAQKYDNAAQILDLGNLKKLQETGRITNNELMEAKKLGAGRELTDSAFKTYKGYMSSLADRIGEQGGFYAQAQRLKIPPTLWPILWNRYMHERPVYDYVSDKPIGKNVNTGNEYLTQEAQDAVRNGKDYSPRMSAEESSDNENSSTNNNSQEVPGDRGDISLEPGQEYIDMVKNDNGKLIKKHIHISHLQEAVDKGYRQQGKV